MDSVRVRRSDEAGCFDEQFVGSHQALWGQFMTNTQHVEATLWTSLIAILRKYGKGWIWHYIYIYMCMPSSTLQPVSPGCLRGIKPASSGASAVGSETPAPKVKAKSKAKPKSKGKGKNKPGA